MGDELTDSKGWMDRVNKKKVELEMELARGPKNETKIERLKLEIQLYETAFQKAKSLEDEQNPEN